jgi:hypothetical protein
MTDAPDAPASAAAAGSSADLALRVQRAVERELAAIDAIIAKLDGKRADAGESEKAARTLASLARTLRELSALQSQQPDDQDDDSGPVDIDEFRRDIARRMDAFVADRAAGCVPGAGEPGSD